jgi:hypothetical protein
VVARPAGVVDRLRAVTVRGRFCEVVSDLSEVRPRIRRVETLERLAGLAIQPHPPRRRELVVEDVSHQRVREPQPERAHGCLEQQPRGDRRLQRREQSRGRTSGDQLQRRDLKLPAEDRRHPKQRAALAAQPPEAATDRRAYACGNRAGIGPGREQSHQLAHEERVALRAPVDRQDLMLIGHAAGAQLDEPRDVSLAEPAQRQHPRDGLASDLRER